MTAAAVSVWREPLRIADWAFVWSFPATEATFLRAKAYSQFCGQASGWADYCAQALSPFEELITPMEHLGLAITKFASLRDFGIALRRRRAIVLFSHCDSRTRIEFRKKMEAPDRVVSMIPVDFDGIIDLSVCRPTSNLIDQIKAHAPLARVAWMVVDLTPAIWLEYYGRFLTRFCSGPVSYLEAERELREQYGCFPRD